jgi:hypothetical protein
VCVGIHIRDYNYNVEMLLLGKNLQSEMSLSEVQHWLGSVTFQGAGRFI